MDESESSDPLPTRGEAEGAQSTDDPIQKTNMQSDMWDGEKMDKDHTVADGERRLDTDPLAEAAMNILRTQKQPKEPDEDDAFLDYGDSDSIGSGKHVEHIDCAIGSDQKLSDISKQLDDLHIDIPEPMVKLKRRSSSVAELSDVEATGSVERFSPREDPVGSAMGSLPLHATTPTSMTSSSSSATELGGAVGASAMIPPIDPEAIQDLEKQCHMVADNLNLMLGHLSNSLHNVSISMSLMCYNMIFM
nr:uncharacterized protein LOC129256759 isoform X2 [Lytechinus pictus]